jgi:hypothetical protein
MPDDSLSSGIVSPPDILSDHTASEDTDFQLARHPPQPTGAAMETHSAPSFDVPLVDDIRTQYHPHSHRPPHIAHFEDYGREEKSSRRQFCNIKKPWSPYQTRLDFEVAELIHETAMNERQTTVMLLLLKRCADGFEKFTIKTHKELQNIWKQCAIKSIGVSEIP